MHIFLISITHNKKRISLLNMLINCISVRSAPQILSIIDEYTFLFFFNFLITGLHNSSVNYLFEIFSFLTANIFHVAQMSNRASKRHHQKFFYKKINKPLKQVHVGKHIVLGF